MTNAIQERVLAHFPEATCVRFEFRSKTLYAIRIASGKWLSNAFHHPDEAWLDAAMSQIMKPS